MGAPYIYDISRLRVKYVHHLLQVRSFGYRLSCVTFMTVANHSLHDFFYFP